MKMHESMRLELGRLPVVLALLVFGATMAFYVSVLEPSERQLAALAQSLEKKAAKANSKPVKLSPEAEAGARLGEFYAFFQREESYTDWLARFYDMAERTGVEARRAEYRRLEPTGVPMVLHEVSVPMTADYAQIRAFSQGVLNAIPVASLDQITFKRQRRNQAQAEADLRFSFYLPKQ